MAFLHDFVKTEPPNEQPDVKDETPIVVNDAINYSVKHDVATIERVNNGEEQEQVPKSIETCQDKNIPNSITSDKDVSMFQAPKLFILRKLTKNCKNTKAKKNKVKCGNTKTKRENANPIIDDLIDIGIQHSNSSNILTGMQDQPAQKLDGCKVTILQSPASNAKTPKKEVCVKFYKDREKFKCSHCNKLFLYEDNLKQHQLLHPNWCIVKCDTCQKLFNSKKNLITHMETHAKRQKCKHCRKSFISPRKLNRHQLSHTNFNCQM